jgi:D-alanine-D-alanine ligase
MALAVHEKFRLRDYSRVDLIISADGEPHFLEVNVAPGITETSLLPQALEAASRDLGSVFAQLVHAAIRRG